MYRGTTPTLTFTFPFEVSKCEQMVLSFAQAGKVILEKKIDDLTKDGNTITCRLTESESLLFDSEKMFVEMQFKICVNGTVSASNIMKVGVKRILCEEIIHGI